MDEAMIQIPIKEYEIFRNSVNLQDKTPLLRDLIKLLQERKQDADRYKEKYEQTERTLQTTLKQLDKCMQYSQSNPVVIKPKPGCLKVKTVSDNKEVVAQGEKVIARDLDDPPPVSRSWDKDSKAVEHDETTSLPLKSVRMSIMGEQTSLKSLPLSLTNLTAPGMSTALLKKLVQENLKLRKLVEKSGKITKYPEDAENVISDLKLKLNKQEQQIRSLKNRLPMSTVDEKDETSSLRSDMNEFEKKIEEYEKTIDMNKVVIESLTSQIKEKEKEKQSLQTLLVEYQQFQASSIESDEKINNLEEQLDELKKVNQTLTVKVEKGQFDLRRMQQQLEKTEQERDVYQQNYIMICSQSRDQRLPVPSYQHMMAPQSSISRQNQPAYTLLNQSQSGQPALPPRPGSNSMTASMYTQEREPPLPPRTPHSSLTTPLPRERKTYKCPRCETVFDVIQTYRDHIKVCLKNF